MIINPVKKRDEALKEVERYGYKIVKERLDFSNVDSKVKRMNDDWMCRISTGNPYMEAAKKKFHTDQMVVESWTGASTRTTNEP